MTRPRIRERVRTSALVLFVTFTATLGCDNRPPPVVVIGIDGLEWRVLEPMIEAGELLHLARFLREGARGDLESELPLLSPMVWTTIATGKGPDTHRVLDFTAPDPGGGGEIVVTSLHRRCKAIWNVLSEAGRSVGVIGWWATWPAEPLDGGFVVSDRIGYHAFIGSERPERGLVHPPRLVEASLAELRDPDTVTWDEARPFMRVSAREFSASQQLDYRDPIAHFRYIYATMESVTRITERLYREESPAVLLVYFEGIDTAGHTYMRYAAPPRPDTDERDRGRFGGAVSAFYRYQDDLLGRIMDTVGEDATYLIVSDHGFLVGEERPRSLNPERAFTEAPRWHRQQGVILALGPGIEPGIRIEGAGIRDIAPTVLALSGVAVAADMTGHVLPEIAPGIPPDRPRPETYEDPRWLRDRRQALTSSPSDEEIMTRLGALGYIQPGVRGAASKARRQVNLGAYHAARGESERAAEMYGRALELDPENPQAHSNLGRLLAREQRFEAALPHLRIAYADDTTNVRVGHWLLIALNRTQSPEGAIEVGESISRLHPDVRVIRINLGVAYRLARRLDRAEALFLALLEEDLDNLTCLDNLGDIEAMRGDLDAAESWYRRALARDPDDAYARQRLVTIGRGDD